MKGIFYRSPNLFHKKEDLYVHSQNIIKFGNKSSTSPESHALNSLLENIR